MAYTLSIYLSEKEESYIRKMRIPEDRNMSAAIKRLMREKGILPKKD